MRQRGDARGSRVAVTWLRGGAVGVAAAALLAVAAGAGTGTAGADPTITDLPSEANGSLTINKFAASGGAPTIPNDGTDQLTGGALGAARGLNGVTFRIRQVGGIDLTTNEGWQLANDLSTAYGAAPKEATITSFVVAAGPPPTSASLVGAQTRETSGATGNDDGTPGQAVFGNLPIGLYYVEEIPGPNTPAGIAPAKPFLVTVPITPQSGADDRTDWLYDVHVYPKNAISGITKSVTDRADQNMDATAGASANHDGVVNWTILSDISGVPVDIDGDGTMSGDEETHNIAAYAIVDALDPRLTYDPPTAPTSALTVSIVQLDGTPLPTPVTLTPGTNRALGDGDYYVSVLDDAAVAVTFSGVTPTSITGTTWVIVEFTGNGLAKLMANDGQRVRVDLPTKVNALGEIPNAATLYPNNREWSSTTGPIGPGVPSQQVQTKWGSINFTKIDNGAAPTPLAGAEFQIYDSSAIDPATRSLLPGAVPLTLDDGDSSTTAGDKANGPVGSGSNPAGSTYVADTAGRLNVGGLRFSAYADDGALANCTAAGFYDGTNDAGCNIYFLVETKAPAPHDGVKYSLLAKPLAFTVDSGTSNTVTPVFHDVVNVPISGGFDLPFTGASGVRALVVLGSLIAGIGLVLIGLTRRRNRRAEAEESL